MSSQETETKRLVCLLMGLFTAAVWAAPFLLFKFIIFKDQYTVAFIAVLCWCVAINAVALLLNAVDKALACCQSEGRIPEGVLHAFTLLGGGPGSTLAMFLCFHKFSKGSYQLWFIVAASLSITFIFGAFGLAYGLEWYHTSHMVSTTFAPTNVTTSGVNISTTQSATDAADFASSSGGGFTSALPGAMTSSEIQT